jgi:hypothetical protein
LEQPKYDRDKKSHEAMQKLKSPLHVASCGEWQLDYKTQGGLRQYYFTTQRELYGGKYPNLLKSFISTVPRHTLSKLFQLCTGHGVLGKYFEMRCINERNHYCKCGQLETVEHVLKECPLHLAKRNYLRKDFPELDFKIILDTKKGLGAIVKFLDSLPQLLY